MYMLQILNLNYLPFNSGEIIHISHITSVHLGGLGFNMNLGFFLWSWVLFWWDKPLIGIYGGHHGNIAFHFEWSFVVGDFQFSNDQFLILVFNEYMFWNFENNFGDIIGCFV
jgi:hypothetical protein